MKNKFLSAGRLFWFLFLLPAAVICHAGCGRDESRMDPHPDGGVDGHVVDGRVDATPPDGPPIDVGGCAEGALRCSGATLEICSGGVYTTLENCEFGCVSSPEPRCGSPVFSNGITMEDMKGGWSDFQPEAGETIIDSDLVTITGPGSPAADDFYFRIRNRDDLGLPPLLILSFRSVFIPEGAIIKVKGERPIALAAEEEIVIEGIVDAGVTTQGVPGPGGYPGGTDGNPGMGPGKGIQGNVGALNILEGGGGGGAFGAGGGAGGAGGTVAGGAGGNTYGNPQVNPLVGGSGGGSGGKGTGGNPGGGGAGGGAVMLASLNSVRIAAVGIITAGGEGGKGGALQEAGGGGGSGGAIVLAAPVVDVYGILAANGGGGGGSETSPPEDGENGRLDGMAAQGGTRGGMGGAGNEISGQSGEPATAHGGGGGGGAGRIRIESRDPPDLTGSILSPGQSTAPFSITNLGVE